MKRIVQAACAVAVSAGAMLAFATAPASAAAAADPDGCHSHWVVNDRSASGFCDGNSETAYKEWVTCFGNGTTKFFGPLTVGASQLINPLSTANCPANHLVNKIGIVKI